MVYDKIIEMICDQFGMTADELSENTSFIEDMGIDSVDVVELVVDLETEFGLDEIPEDELKKMRTIGDLVAYVTAHSEE